MIEYTHGGDIYSRRVELDFSVNVNPLGLPEAVKRAAAASLENCGVYPDSSCGRLREALVKKEGVSLGKIVCGNGAADLIFGLAFALKPKNALVLAPTFSEYAQALEASGCRIKRLYLSRERHFFLDPEALIEAIAARDGEGEEKLDLVFLCNPNNPTGQAVKGAQLEPVAALCKKRGIRLIVDQCFEDFLDCPEDYSMIPLLSRFPNVTVLKAFTKSYAMAGLRLGYVLCGDEELAGKLCQVRQPWSVSGVAQEAGIAALKEEAYLTRAREMIREERVWMGERLKQLGFRVYPSMVNYLLFEEAGESGLGGEPPKQEPLKQKLPEQIPLAQNPPTHHSLKEALLERGILIRSCHNFEGLDGSFYRVCIRRRQENERLIQALAQIKEEQQRWQKRS